MLGARVLSDGRPGAALERRMRTAIALYRGGAAPRLLLSGGGGGALSEAEAMRRMALAESVPESALLLEPRSADTVENALESARLLAAVEHGPVVLVTDRWHAPRARLLFRLAGLPVQRVVAPPASFADRLSMGAVELAKTPVGVIRMLYRRAVRDRARGPAR